MADSGDERDPLEQLAEDYLDRQRRGERPTVREYVARYPERSEEIRDLFSALILIEGLKPEADATVGHAERDSTPRRERPLERLADYRILREVGRGGMGVVYEAEQESLGRRVALKVLAPWATPGPRQVQRFLREARSAAQLHHTHIVPIFGVGEHDGLHYYAMQFIPGLGLDQVLDQVRSLKKDPLGTRRDRGARPPGDDSATVVARTLVGELSATGSSLFPPLPSPSRQAELDKEPGLSTPRFGAASIPLPGESDSSATADPAYRYACGVARIGVQVAEALQHAHEQGMLHRDIKPSNLLLDGHGTAWVTDFGLVKADDDEDLTHTGDLVGTLRYMAPERFWGRCDARSDVYSLGLTLFELLALRPAFETPDRHRLIHEITQAEPPRLRRLVPTVPRDLETIVHTAMAKDPAERYRTAGLLAEDLRCWLGHKPIRARTSPVWERLIKWGRRNPMLAALIVVSVLALSTVVATLAVGYNQVTRSYQRERRISYFQRIALVEQAWSDNDVSRAEEMLDACPAEFRGWEWRYLKQLCHADRLTIQAHSRLQPNAIAYSHDGALLATTSDSGAIELRQTGTWQLARSLGAIKGDVYALAFSPDGTRLASASGDGSVHVWDVATGQVRVAKASRHGGAALSVVFSPDGRFIASSSGDFWGTSRDQETSECELTIWDSKTGLTVHTLSGHVGTVHRAAFSPDGALLASAGGDGTARLWDVATGTPVRTLKGHAAAVTGCDFSPDGSRLATAGRDGTLLVWGVNDGERILNVREPDERFFGVAFSPDGRHLAAAGRNWVVTLWDTTTGRKERTFRGHSREVVGVAFSPDGRHLASADYGGVVKVWDPASHQEALTLDGQAGPITAVAFSPDSQRVATTGSRTRLWDARTGQQAPLQAQGDEPTAAVAFSPDGRKLAEGGIKSGAVTLRDPATGQILRTFKAHSDSVTALAFSPDGRFLATASRDRTVAVLDLATGLRRLELNEHALAIRGVAFSPDGRFLAVATGDVAAIRTPGVVTIQNAATGRLLHTLAGHRGGVSDLAFSPDGSRLATASWDRTVAVWDPYTGRQEHAFRIRGLIVWAVAYSPDGRRLVAADNIGRMQFWDSATHLEVLTLRGHMDRIYDLAFSRDGRRLASVGRDGTAKVWDAPPLGRDAEFR